MQELFPRCPRQAGIALVLVLWVITLLTVIAGSFAISTRTNTQLVNNITAQARARALADAGIHRAMYELLLPGNDQASWKADGKNHVFVMEGAEITVSARPETAKIDLNRANEVLLKGLFVSAGATEEQAQQYLEGILDWRDADELVRPQGAEREQYQSAGLTQVPANADFTSVEDLRLVIGIPPEILRKVTSALTVYSGQPGIDSRVAAPDVLAALPGSSPADIEDYVLTRYDRLTSGNSVEPFPPAAAFTSTSEGRVYNLKAFTRMENGERYTRDAIVKLGEPLPYQILGWRDDRP
jgi:general secretion pathway protein K